MLSMLISIESIIYILFLEKYFFLKFINTAPTRGSMTLVVIQGWHIKSEGETEFLTQAGKL